MNVFVEINLIKRKLWKPPKCISCHSNHEKKFQFIVKQFTDEITITTYLKAVNSNIAVDNFKKIIEIFLIIIPFFFFFEITIFRLMGCVNSFLNYSFPAKRKETNPVL